MAKFSLFQFLFRIARRKPIRRRVGQGPLMGWVVPFDGATQAFETAMAARHTMETFGSTVFAGRMIDDSSSPLHREPSAHFRDSAYIREFWGITSLRMPEAMCILEAMDFPQCLEYDCDRSPQQVREIVTEFVLDLHAEHPLMLVAADQWVITFGFKGWVEPPIRERIARDVLALNARFFPKGPMRSRLAKQWANQSIVSFGPS